jgi:hypothetical protein
MPMSQGALEQTKGARRLCQACRDRKARFRYRGVVKADRDHTLCFECFRVERDRRRAQLLATVRPAASTMRVLEPRRTSTARDVEHRQRMLAHLQTVAHGPR